MQNFTLWVIILVIVAPILGIGLHLALRKHLNESVKKRRKIVLIIFFTLIVIIASVSVIYSLSMYGNLSGVTESLKETFSNRSALPLSALLLFLLVYNFFRKDKKSHS